SGSCTTLHVGGVALGRSICFFFFSSRRRHTRLVSDWSSDVCSSDLAAAAEARSASHRSALAISYGPGRAHAATPASLSGRSLWRSEERRVGKEGRSRGSACH